MAGRYAGVWVLAALGFGGVLAGEEQKFLGRERSTRT